MFLAKVYFTLKATTTMHFKGPIVNFFDGKSLSRHKVRIYILQVPNNETFPC